MRKRRTTGVSRLRHLLMVLALVLGVVGVPVAVAISTAGPAMADSSSQIASAVSWAESELGSTAWDVDGGECLLFVYDAYMDGANVNIGTADTAYDYWNDYPSAQVTDGSTPPEGALVFWGPSDVGGYNNPDGHVALSLGDGNVISSMERSYTGVHEFSISSRNAAGYPYLGWMMPPGVTASGSLPSFNTTASRPSAVQYGSEMDVFVRGGDGNIWKDTWNGSSWSGFSSLGGGNLVNNPVAMVYTDGSYQEMDVFALGSNGQVYKDTWNGSYWSGFNTLGGNMTGSPSAMEWTGDSELDVYATGASNGPVYKDTWNGSSWSGWNSLGGGLASSPYAIQYNSEMDVFARNSGNTLWKDTWNGSSWSGWNSLGNNMAGDPVAMEYAGWELDVYSQGTNCALWKDGWNGSSWGGFGNMGGCLTGDPYAMQYTNGSYQEMDVYVIGTNNAIFKDTWNGSSWSGFSSLGGSMTGPPTAVEYTNGSYQEMDVYAVGTDGNVYKDTWNGSSWSGFSSLG